MIETVKEGQLPDKKPYQGTCGYCNTVIKCLQEDGVFVSARDQRDSDYLEVPCPLCAKKINAYPIRGGSLIPQENSWGIR